MLVFCWLFTFELFTTTATHHSAIKSKAEFKDKRVNFALETVFEYNDKNISVDLEFLDNVDQFYGKKTVVDKKTILRSDVSHGKLEKFTDFIRSAIKILNKYSDEDLENFFYVLSDEVRKYHYRGCKFHELIDNYGLRRYIASELDAFKNKSANHLRNKIVAIANKIKKGRLSSNESDLVDFINSLYRQDSVEKFMKILVSIDDYRLKNKGHKSLVQIVREGIRSIIFDHYTELNHNARTALKSKIDEYWKYLMDLSKTLVLQLNEEEIKLRNYGLSIKDNYMKEHKAKTHKTHSKMVKQKTDTTKTGKTYIYIHEHKHLHVKYETPTYIHTTERKRKANILTFMTLYPKFVSDDLLPEYRVATTRSTLTKPRNEFILWKERDRDSVIEKRQRIYDSETEVKKQRHKTTTFNKHKETSTITPMYDAIYLDLQYKPNTYKMTELKSKPKPNFQAYPKHIVKATKRTPGMIKKNIAETSKESLRFIKKQSIENPMQMLSYEGNQKSYKRESAEPRPELPIKHRGRLEAVTMGLYVPRKINPNKKFQNEIDLKAHDDPQKSLKLFIKKPDFEIDMPRIQFPYSNPMKALRNSDKNDPVITDADSLVEEIIDDEHRIPYGQSFKGIPKDKIVVDKRILTRLQELETKLKVVKTQLKNDTEIIKDLNRKVQIANNHYKYKRTKEYDNVQTNKESKTGELKELVFDLAAHINSNNERPTKDFKRAGLTQTSSRIFKWNSYVRNTHQPDLNGNKKVNDEKYEFDTSTFNRYKNNKDQLLKENVNNMGIIKKDIKQSHELNNYLKKTYFPKAYRNDKYKGIHEYDRSTINRLDDYDDDNQSQGNNEKNRDSSNKSVRQRYELNNYVNEKVMSYSSKTDQRKYDIDKNTFYRDQIYDKNNKNSDGKYVYKNKNYNDASESLKKQEIKYNKGKTLSLYKSERDESMKTRERIFDSDSNNNNNNNHHHGGLLVNNNNKRDKISSSVRHDTKLLDGVANSLNNDRAQNHSSELGNHKHDQNEVNDAKKYTYTTEFQKDYKKHFDSTIEPFEDEGTEIFYKAKNRRQNPDLSNNSHLKYSGINSNASISVTREMHPERNEFNIGDEHINYLTKAVLRTGFGEGIKKDYDINHLSNKYNEDMVHTHKLDDETFTKHEKMHDQKLNKNYERNVNKTSKNINDNNDFEKDTKDEHDMIYESTETDRINHDSNQANEEKHNDYGNELEREPTVKYDLDRNKNDLIFKSASNKDVIHKYVTQNYFDASNSNNTYKTQFNTDIDGGSQNHYPQTNKPKQNITDNKPNKSLDSGLLSKHTEHVYDAFEEKYKNEKEDNYTVTLNSNKDQSQTTDSHIETTTEKATPKNKDIDLKISQGHDNYTEFENDCVNRTTTVILTTVKPKSSTESLAPTTKRILTETTSSSPATILTNTSLAVATYRPPDIPFNSPANASEEGIIADPDQMDPIDYGPGTGQNTRRLGESPSLAILRLFEGKNRPIINDTVIETAEDAEDFDTLVNNTLDLYRNRKNDTDLYDRETYDILNSYVAARNVTEYALLAPPPNFLTTPPDLHILS